MGPTLKASAGRMFDTPDINYSYTRSNTTKHTTHDITQHSYTIKNSKTHMNAFLRMQELWE